MHTEKEGIIISHKNLVVRLTKQADDKIISMLSGTVLGTKGGLRHQLTGIGDTIKAYGDNIRFVSLYMGKRLAGTVGFCYRKIRTAEKTWHSTYLRYLAFMPLFQSALTVRKDNSEQAGKRKQADWKEKIFSFFRHPYTLDFPGYGGNNKHIVYAYVETKNERSKKLIRQVGFENIRSFITVPFSRFNPVASDRVSKLTDKDKDRMRKLLDTFYKDHSFYTNEFTFYGENYYVYREGDDIIAGLSAIPDTLRIVEIPGLKGWLFMNAAHRLPFLNRIFHPQEMRFLILGSIFFREGREKELEQLIESVCAIRGYNTALTWFDDKSEMYSKIVAGTNLGMINKLLNLAPALVYANFINLSDEEKKEFYDRPVFISGFDFM